jgi:ribose 5-phosphate isomerase B
MKKMRVAIGSDHGGFVLKKQLVLFLRRKGFVVDDLGTHSADSMDYPDTAAAVARRVARGEAQRGVLVCKSGIGNSIVANKFRGVRAALCYNLKSAKLSRLHNDANILVLGAMFVTADRARRMLEAWLSTEFEGGRHQRRLDKIERIEGTCSRA